MTRLGALIIFVIFSLTAPCAFACTYSGLSIGLRESLQSPDGSIVAHVVRETLETEVRVDFEFEVSQGTDIFAGELTQLGDPIVSEVGDSLRFEQTWVKWTPDSALSPGEYTVTVTLDEDGTMSEWGTVNLTVTDTTFEIADVSEAWVEEWSQEQTCCEPGGICGDSCFVDYPCRICWPDRYVYIPELTPTTSGAHAGLIRYELTQGDHSDSVLVSGTSPRVTELRGVPDSDERICVKAVALDDDLQPVRSTDPICREIAEFPTYEPREFDSSQLQAQCDELNPEEDDANNDDDDGSDTTQMFDNDNSSSDGCATTRTIPTNPMVVLVFLFGILFRRRLSLPL